MDDPYIPNIVMEEYNIYKGRGIVSEIDSDDKWRTILGRYGEEWSSNSIKIAKNHLLNPSGWGNSKNNFSANMPNGVNYIMMYYCLRKNGTPINKNITQEQMLLLWVFYNSDNNYLKVYINRVLNTQPVTHDTLVNIAMLLPRLQSNDKYDYYDIEYITTRDYLYELDPNTNNMAIVLAAKNYKVDLTLADDPLHEYYNLNQQMNDSNSYIPTDINMLSYPNLWNLSKSFNSQLPPSIYTEDIICDLLYEEGFIQDDIDDIDDTYDMLLQTISNENIYFGLHPRLAETSIIDLEIVDNVNPDEIISYGIRDKYLKWITIDELIRCWQYSKSIINPFTNIQFTERELRKLQRWMYAGSGKEKLLKLMLDLEITQQEVKDKISELISLPDAYQILEKLWETVMYLRGWDGQGSYPIAKSERKISLEPEIEIKYAENIGKIYNHPILELPLINSNGINYSIAAEEDGNTIKSRLDIINQGNHYQNTLSCIRVSSNILAYTINYYLTLLGYPKYQPENLEIISD